MCGISGAFSNNAKTEIKQISKKLKHRGPDNSQTYNFNNLFLSHNLLSIVNHIPQPIYDSKHVLVSNCEIYNWEQLSKKYNINAKNDSDFLFNILKQNKTLKELKKILKELNGVYSFAFFWQSKDGLKGYLVRDIFGIRPLWYYIGKSKFYFASEKKALPSLIRNKSFDLNPRNILSINLSNFKSEINYRGFYKANPRSISYSAALKKTEELIENAVKSRINTDKKIGVALGGGVDASLIAYLASKHKDIKCYNVSFTKDSDDLKYALKLAKSLNLNLKVITPSLKQAKVALPKVIKIIESSDPVKVSIALAFYFIAKQVKKDKLKIILLGNGADDIFCGYQRFKKEYSLVNDSISRLRKMYDTDFYRDDCIFMNFGVEARFPFLDKALVDYVLPLPDDYKIFENTNKKILRDIASKYIPEEIAYRPKKAIQYGTKSDLFLTRLAKEQGYKNKGLFLSQFLKQNDTSLACLFSGGKDSVFALHIMHNLNYKIKCLITIDSENKDSYMYHTPCIDLVSLQAQALDMPLILKQTKGEKEQELKELEQGMKEAKNKYKVNGIITGALFSNYQRTRIEIIADKLGLKVFSPLWHMDQYDEMHHLLTLGIVPIITKIAAYGLDPKVFLGVPITHIHLETLQALNKTIGFNVAGEGGEFETLVLDAPLFKTHKLQIQSATKNITSQYESELVIKDAKLIKK
jgi:diphthine-ammonia ligase